MEKITLEMKGKDRIYKNEKGETICAYGEDIESIIGCSLEPLNDFLNLIFDDDETQRMAFIMKSLLRDAERRIYEPLKFAEEHLGSVTIYRAAYDQCSVPPDTVLGAFIEPLKKVKKEVKA
jgi:hypothetical protein